MGDIMSLENKKTLDSYQKKAFKYLENNKKLDINEVKKSNKKLHKFIKENLSNIPKGKILEIGSADGEIAKYIKELGYDITSSDIADDFIKELKQKGFPIARRTVAKYREQLGFAIARLRKQ